MDSSSTPPPQPVVPAPLVPDESVAQTPEPAETNDDNTDQSFEISHDDHPIVKPPVVERPGSQSIAETVAEVEPQAQTQPEVAPLAAENTQPDALAVPTQPVIQPPQPVLEPITTTTLPASSDLNSVSINAQTVEPTLADSQIASPIPEDTPQAASPQTQITEPAQPTLEPASTPTPTPTLSSTQAEPVGIQQPTTEPTLQPIPSPDEPVDMFADVSPGLDAQSTQPAITTPMSQPVSSFATPPPVDQSLQFVEQSQNANPDLIQPVIQPQNQTQDQLQSQPIQKDMSQPQAAIYSDPQIEQTETQAQMQTQTKRKKLPIIFGAVGGLIVLIALGFIIKAQFFNSKLTAKDVTDASSTLQKIEDNISSIEDDITTLTGASDSATIQKAYKDSQAKIKEANTDYALLKKSKTLKYASVQLKYKDLDAKWEPYMNFLNNNLADINILKPSVVALNDKLTSTSQDNNADVSVQALTNYNQALTDGASNIKKIDVKSESIKTIKVAYVKYLDDSSALCVKSIKKVKAGDTIAGLDCLLGSDKISKSYTDSLDKSAKQFIDEDNKYSVTDQITALSGSFSDLLPMIKN